MPMTMTRCMRLRCCFRPVRALNSAEVRQHTWSSGTNGVVAATFSLRLKGKPVSFVVPLAFVKIWIRHLP